MSLELRLAGLMAQACREEHDINGGIFSDNPIMQSECAKMEKKNVESILRKIMISKTRESKYCIFTTPKNQDLTCVRIQIKCVDGNKKTMTFSFKKEDSWDHYIPGMSDYFEQSVPKVIAGQSNPTKIRRTGRKMTKAMRLLIDAQRESDAAKGIYALGSANSIRQGTKQQHYVRKYIDELRLLRLLSTTKRPEMSYYVVKGYDQANCLSYIVYFEFDLNGKKFQISFHNPYPMCKALREYVGRGTKTEWDGDVGGSRNAASKALRSI